MAINGNLPGETSASPSTTNYFNNFYTNPTGTSPMINDAVVAFFQKITGSKDTGTNLAAAVIYTCLQQNMDPMSVVEQLIALNNKQKLIAVEPVNPWNQYKSYVEGDLVSYQGRYYSATTNMSASSTFQPQNWKVTGYVDGTENAGSSTTNQNAQDAYVFNSQTGTWSTGTKQYAKPGPSSPYTNVTELDAYLTMLLNLNRVSTSLLGISNSPQVSPYVQRMILA